MKLKSFLNILAMVFFCASLAPALPAADVIILKDGTQIKVQRVWEEDGLVRFTLPDYNDIVVTYSKDIVDHIEAAQEQTGPQLRAESSDKATAVIASDSQPPGKSGAPASGQEQQPVATKTGALTPGKSLSSRLATPSMTGAATASETPRAPAAPQPAGSSGEAVMPPAADDDMIADVSGILFYDPRRSYKYQTGPDSRHRSLSEALAKLAAKFDRTPEWVGQHLGNTNDLAQIYLNLSQGTEKTAPETGNQSEAAGILFYDPRRSYKYQVSTEAKYRTLDEAINALARMYARPPEWIVENLGESNDVGEIHRHLEQQVAEEAIPNHSRP